MTASSSKHQAIDNEPEGELYGNIYRVSPESILDAILPRETSHPINTPRWSVFVEDLSRDNEIQDAIMLMNNASTEDQVYKPFATMANRVTTLSKNAFANDVKRQVVFHGPSYHLGGANQGTEFSCKLDRPAVLCDNQEQAGAHLEREEQNTSPPADILGIDRSTSLLVIGHKVTELPVMGTNTRRDSNSEPLQLGRKDPISEAEDNMRRLPSIRDRNSEKISKKRERLDLPNLAYPQHIGSDIRLIHHAYKFWVPWVIGHTFGLILNDCHAILWAPASGIASTFAGSETLGFKSNFRPPARTPPDTRATLPPPTLNGFSIPYDGGSVKILKSFTV
ncbi:hypothetical protein FRB99_006741 [Tulasnella sp. 403]|nr:hypothetical protein FRB99_006741 [Tulasnella sp. 403]